MRHLFFAYLEAFLASLFLLLAAKFVNISPFIRSFVKCFPDFRSLYVLEDERGIEPMTNKEFEEAHEIAFDAFCKSVIRNACRDAHRKLNTHKKYECQMTDFTETRLCVYEERYSCANILVPVGTELVEINDLALAEAMKRLPPRQRDLIYKSFFLEMKDEEIAVSQHRKVQSLKRTKYNVLQKLRRIIGEFEHEKDWGL